jgi:CRISPR system Cascade subunit CasD
MKVLLLRFDAPLMSFGGVMVDQNGPTDRFPGQSLLVGLLANALGYRHGDAGQIGSIQERLEYAARWDIDPVAVRDYQTVDLGQAKMREPGWTTRGTAEHREGGAAAKYGTHQRYRHYWADGVMTVALALSIGDPPTEAVAVALEMPARPLFLGRKSCLPASRLYLDQVTAPDVLAALREVPRATRAGRPSGRAEMAACWPVNLGASRSSRLASVYDRRDWRNQVHAGKHSRFEGLIEEEHA